MMRRLNERSWSRCELIDPILVVETVIKLGRAVAGWKRARRVSKGNSQSDILLLFERCAFLCAGEDEGERFSLSFSFGSCGEAMASILASSKARPEAWVRSKESNLASSVV